VLFGEGAEVSAGAGGFDDLVGERALLAGKRDDRRMERLSAALLHFEAMEIGTRVVFRYADAAPHAGLEHLSEQELATDFFAVVGLGKALFCGLGEEV